MAGCAVPAPLPKTRENGPCGCHADRARLCQGEAQPHPLHITSGRKPLAWADIEEQREGAGRYGRVCPTPAHRGVRQKVRPDRAIRSNTAIAAMLGNVARHSTARNTEFRRGDPAFEPHPTHVYREAVLPGDRNSCRGGWVELDTVLLIEIDA